MNCFIIFLNSAIIFCELIIHKKFLNNVALTRFLKAPIASGDTVGTISYKIEGNNYEYPLIAEKNVDSVMYNVAAVVFPRREPPGTVRR